MASPYTNANMVSMNRKQLQTVAKNVNVNPVVVNHNTPIATLITAIKAK